MKILFLTRNFPFPLVENDRIRNYQYIQQLSFQHKVDILSMVEAPPPEEHQMYVKNYCNELMWASPSIFMKELDRQIHKYNYDLIYVSHIDLMAYAECYPHVILLDPQGLSSETPPAKWHFFRQKNSLSPNMRRQWIERADSLIVSSEDTQRELSKFQIEENSFCHVPISYNPSFENYPQESHYPFRLLLLTSLSDKKQIDAITHFLKNVAKKLDSELYEIYVVGGNPPNHLWEWNKYENIHIVGQIENEAAYIQKCNIFVEPSNYEDGVGMKVVQAFAYGLPCISTPHGARGVRCTHGHEIWIADKDEEILEGLLHLQNPESYQHMQQQAYQVYKKFYQGTKGLDVAIEKAIIENRIEMNLEALR